MTNSLVILTNSLVILSEAKDLPCDHLVILSGAKDLPRDWSAFVVPSSKKRADPSSLRSSG